MIRRPRILAGPAAKALPLAVLFLSCGGGERKTLDGPVARRREPGATPVRAGGAPPAGARADTPGPFRVGLLSPGPVSDAGWNASAYEGLKLIEKELDATVAQIETRTPPQFEEGFRGYAAQGFRLVFGHGYEFQEAAAKVGAEFPGTVFITSSGTTVRPNVSPMAFRLEEATYLLGMIAGRMSRSGKAGVVGGMEIPSVASTFLAFEAGVHAVKPGMPVLKAYVGNWEDVSAAKEAAAAQLRAGADFVFHNADAAGIGMFRAVEEAAASGKAVWAFGSNKDQAPVAPTVVLASAVLDVPRAFLVVAREVRDGKFRPGVRELGMRDEIVSLRWNPALAARVPDALKAEVEAARQAILAGRLAVPKQL